MVASFIVYSACFYFTGRTTHYHESWLSRLIKVATSDTNTKEVGHARWRPRNGCDGRLMGKDHGEKRCEIQRWRPRNGCDGRLMVKILITTVQVNLCCLLHKDSAPISPELSLLKFLPLTYVPSQPFLGRHLWISHLFHHGLFPLTYHHSHFLAAPLDFTSFFTMAFLGAAPFFTAWLFLIRYHFFLYLYLSFFFTTGKIIRH